MSVDRAAFSALFKCNKCGSCTSVCPLYQQTVYEGMVARGKLALVESMLDGGVVTAEAARGVMETCLLCGACAQNCPSLVPTTDLFLQARSAFAERLGIPLAVRALLTVLASPRALGTIMPPLSLVQRSGLPALLEGPLGTLAPEGLKAAARTAPPVALQAFRSRPLPSGRGTRGRVAYFAGCFMNWGYADAARGTCLALSRAGYQVESPAVVCCGVPHRAYGDAGAALDLARKNVAALEGYEAVVSDCASCGAALKEYGRLLAGDPAFAERAQALSSRVADAAEFLVKQGYEAPRGETRLRVTWHDPCHLVRGQGVKVQPRDVLRSIPGVELVEMKGADVCCGGAGSFCVTHPELSQAVGGTKAENVMATGADAVVTQCPACLSQLRAMLKSKGAATKVIHLGELLAQSYQKSP
ncbi:MAG: (Fe-S)-binding protein [Candidatus Methylomirabilales bacterium]